MNFPALPSSLEIKGEVYETIQAAQKELMVPRIQSPKRPQIKGDLRMIERLRQLSNETEIWASEMQTYESEMATIRLHNMKVDALILAFIKKESGLNDIPEQYQNKVFSKAWSDGHSSGYYEVYQQLCELVEIFE